MIQPDLGFGLYLLPNLLWPAASPAWAFPESLPSLIGCLDGLIAESEKGARKFLGHFGPVSKPPLCSIPIELLNEHSPKGVCHQLIKPLAQKQRWGLICDAGLPILADPGAELVRLCNANNVSVWPLPGPSSILYALMLSGFSAQRFTFHGYLPRSEVELACQLTKMEKAAKKGEGTQLFIEAPYRNHKLVSKVIATLDPKTLFAAIWGLTGPEQGALVNPVKIWKKRALPPIQKVPAVFLLAAPTTKGSL